MPLAARLTYTRAECEQEPEQEPAVLIPKADFRDFDNTRQLEYNSRKLLSNWKQQAAAQPSGHRIQRVTLLPYWQENVLLQVWKFKLSYQKAKL